ncbi:MAG: RNA polymerase sigma factor [Muribaculaceae bacterium]|nr:RNA polymerase sigma factor [Muribaculaceae bacterium]
MKKLDELALITRCVLADDRQAFGQLVEAYQSSVRRFFLNLTAGDAALSDDLSQETFIKAYVNLRAFKGVASFSTWLYRIGYNEFYTHCRRTHEERLDDTVGIVTLMGGSNASNDALEANLTVQEAMSRLSDTERAVVTLFYIEDKPLKQVARIMNLPEGTVKSHLHRAKSRMTTFLKNN